MEIGLPGIFDSWSCFSKNPVLATRILIDMMGAPMMHSNPVRHMLELEKNGYLEDTKTLAIGTALLYSIAFTVAFSFMYLTYGTLWI